MGKAARRKRRTQSSSASTKPALAPYVARPFEALAGETDWVAMREIVPAATAPLQVRLPANGGAGEGEGNGSEGGSAGEGEAVHDILLVSVLPGAVPALHRGDGAVLVALQSRTSSGDASRDIVQAIQAAVSAPAGTPINSLPAATADTPRLQDVIVGDDPIEVTVHDDFNFWISEDTDSEAAKASLEQMNDAVVPTVRIAEVPSAYWCTMTGRAYIRWILPDDEDEATRALARLQAAGEHTLGEGTTLLGAFRAAGLLVPVLEVDPAAEPASHGPALAELAQRYAGALAVTDDLTPAQRRARDGLISRQITLR